MGVHTVTRPNWANMLAYWQSMSSLFILFMRKFIPHHPHTYVHLLWDAITCLFIRSWTTFEKLHNVSNCFLYHFWGQFSASAFSLLDWILRDILEIASLSLDYRFSPIIASCSFHIRTNTRGQRSTRTLAYNRVDIDASFLYFCFWSSETIRFYFLRLL